MLLRNLLVTGLLFTTAFAHAETIETSSILSAASGDFNGDGRTDLVMLVANKDNDVINIHFFLRDKAHDLLRPDTVARDKIEGNVSLDGSFGSDPSVEIMPNGSVAINSMNEGIGRSRWRERLTIAYRNSDFIVAGFTYDYYDTLDPEANGNCDLNVMTGKGKKNDTAFSAEARFIRVDDWLRDYGAEPCGIE